MSIIIKANELNTIIYKYLLEAGLKHTAYNMYNEARLEQSLQEYKFDIKSGHLLMLLEKALIFNQIESHVSFDQHQQCFEPFYLLKTHTCKIAQKIKKNTQKLQQQLNNQITEAIKRTNAIYNTQMPNKKFDQIVYEARGINYFEKFHKIRYRDGTEDIQTQNQDLSVQVFDGYMASSVAIYDKEANVILTTQNDLNEGKTVVDRVIPCSLNNQLLPLKMFKITPQHLIMVFGNNEVKIIPLNDEKNPIQLKIPLSKPIISLQFNKNFPNLIIFSNENQFYVINVKNMSQILMGQGKMQWISYDQYLIFFQNGELCYKSLLKQENILSYNLKDNFIQEIEVSHNKTFFYVRTTLRKIMVFTFQKTQPLYILDFSQEEQETKSALWIHKNQADYLAILTDLAIRIWDVEMNSFCLKIPLLTYEENHIQTMAFVQNDLSTFLLGLGQEYIICADITNQKVQRLQKLKNLQNMRKVDNNSVVVATSDTLYFLSVQNLADIFK